MKKLILIALVAASMYAASPPKIYATLHYRLPFGNTSELEYLIVDDSVSKITMYVKQGVYNQELFYKMAEHLEQLTRPEPIKPPVEELPYCKPIEK